MTSPPPTPMDDLLPPPPTPTDDPLLPPPPSPPLTGRDKEGKGKGRVYWNDLKRAYFVKLLTSYNSPRYRAQKGWTKEAWSKIKKQMNLMFPSENLTMSQIKDQEQNLKKAFKFLKKLSELEGFRWDYEKNMVDAPPDVWQPLLESDRKARQWHDKPFPLYTELHYLYDGKFTEGRHFAESGAVMISPIQGPISGTVPLPAFTLDPVSCEETDNDAKEVDGSEDSPADPPPTESPVLNQPQSSASIKQARSKLLYDNGLGLAKKKRLRKNTSKGDYVAMWRGNNMNVEGTEKMAGLNHELLVSVMEMERKHRDEDWERERQQEYKYSTERCIKVYQGLEGFTIEDSVKAFHFFRDQYSREFFLSMAEDDRSPWLRAMFDQL